ncbi:Polypyrimidine tract-binding protein homolog 1 [Linum perenne]
MSTSGHPQFRYTQTPSKVLHLRNLPWECSEEELVELCKPFGKIVNTKSNVGANRNQAFVEFADPNQAIQMVSYYASSSDPAQVRGKAVYIQYSNRHEIVNNKTPADNPGNVLLVTIEGVEAGDVSIDVIHLVFSAFGFVHKIATFEKAAGFQALIQFTDAETASSARDALDGRSIPRQVYLLPDHVDSCNLRISYSAHVDLNIKFQSHRSSCHLQLAVGPDGKRKEPENNVLLASIENMQYAVTLDVFHTVFSAFGNVQKIAIFEKNGSTQALIQYPDVATATSAKDALEGHCIYDGGYCKLHLSYSRHTDLNVKAYSDKSRDYTIPDASSFAASSWQHYQAGPVYAATAYTPGAPGVAPQASTGQVPRPGPVYGHSTSTYPQHPPMPSYATAAESSGSQGGPASSGMTDQPGGHLNMRSGDAPPPGQHPYYSG